jgi:hypothetical protein
MVAAAVRRVAAAHTVATDICELSTAVRVRSL